MKQVRINDRIVGDDQPCFIVAEAGVNHNGSIVQAKQLINAAKDAGADAIKFQLFKTEQVVTEYAERAQYQKKNTESSSQYDLLKKLELTNNTIQELYSYAETKDIIFLCSVFDERSVDLLDQLGISAFKVPSGEITNFPLLKYIAKKKKPIILSTGMSTLREIGEAINVIDDDSFKDIVLLYCVTSYPAEIKSVNLGVLPVFKRRFGFPVGFSDHTIGMTITIAARALGAVLIEKHLTLDKAAVGPDHKASLEPNEFKEMVKAVRTVEEILGTTLQRSSQEEEIKKLVRRSIVASTRIPKGAIILESMLAFKRPGIGIAPKFIKKVVGRKAKFDIEFDELLTFEKIV